MHDNFAPKKKFQICAGLFTKFLTFLALKYATKPWFYFAENQVMWQKKLIWCDNTWYCACENMEKMGWIGLPRGIGCESPTKIAHIVNLFCNCRSDIIYLPDVNLGLRTRHIYLLDTSVSIHVQSWDSIFIFFFLRRNHRISISTLGPFGHPFR